MRLGRVPEFDERSRAFPIRSLLPPRAPRSYTWSCKATLDQGTEGACVGFSWTHERIARPVVGWGDAAAARSLYHAAQGLDPWAGGAYPGADPFYEGTSVLAGAKAAQNAGHFTEYRWAFGLDDVLLTLGYRGPVVLGLDWHEDMFDPDADGLLHVSGGVAGGHAILANGVSVRRRLVRLHNSWGADWGLDGEAFIGFDDLDRLLAADGEACIPTGRVR